MPTLRNIVLAVMPRRWRLAAEKESRAWATVCGKCGQRSSIWDLGGLRWKAAGRPAIGARCAACGEFALHRIGKDEPG